SAYDGLSLATALYQLPLTDYHDIVNGSNGPPPGTAGAGYDLVTGIGTPRANLLAADLVGPLQPPNAPSNLVLTTDSGVSTSDGITNVNTPTFSGSAAANSTVTLYASNVQVGSGIANSSGIWNITLGSALADGNYNVT